LQHFLRQEQRSAIRMLVVLVARELLSTSDPPALTPKPKGDSALMDDFRR
jgi:hypothetical protein